MQDLARLLGTRFGLDSEPLFTTLVAGGEVVLAQDVNEEDAAYLCDVLRRMGIRGTTRGVEIAAAPAARPDVKDTILDARGAGGMIAKEAADRQPSFDHRSVNLSHSNVPARRGPAQAKQTLQWTSSKQYEMTQLAAGDTPASRATTPHSSPGSADGGADAGYAAAGRMTSGGERAAPERAATVGAERPFRADSDGEGFEDMWSSLLADAAPDDAPAQPQLASSKPAGWATVLGESVNDAPAAAAPSPAARPPSIEEVLEDPTARWEISFEAVDLDEEFSKSADDLLRDLDESTDVMRVSTDELLRATELEAPPAAFQVTRAPTPQPLAHAMGSTPRALPARHTPSPGHRPWLGGLLSAFVPGAGQVYNGQVGKALLFGFGSVLILPWLLSVVDAVTVGRHIAAGRLRPPNSGRPVFVAVFCIIAAPALALFAHQAGGAIAKRVQSGSSLSTDEDDARNAAIVARGAAAIEIERAFYHSDESRRQVEAELKRSGAPMPGHPAYGLTPRERSRRASTTLSKAQEACDSKDQRQCMRLLNEALALDPTNKLGWSLLVQARKAQPNWVPPPREEAAADAGAAPESAPDASDP